MPPLETPAETKGFFRRYLPETLAVTGVLLLFLFPTSPRQAPNALSAAVIESVPSPFESVTLEAKAAYVLDANTGEELFSLNGDSQLPLASLTKVMTAVTALSLIPEYTTITIDRSFLVPEGDSGLFVDEQWKLADLLNLTLITSSNDGARAVAAAVGAFAKQTENYNIGKDEFIRLMNKKAKDLGLTQTFFINETGLDENNSISGSYGSARDVAHLFKYAVTEFPEVFKETAEREASIISQSNLEHKVSNTNKGVNSIPRLLGSKTGFTDLAGGNLVIAFDAGFSRPIIVSVLGSTQEGRFSDAEALVWAALEYLATQ